MRKASFRQKQLFLVSWTPTQWSFLRKKVQSPVSFKIIPIFCLQGDTRSLSPGEKSYFTSKLSKKLNRGVKMCVWLWPILTVGNSKAMMSQWPYHVGYTSSPSTTEVRQYWFRRTWMQSHLGPPGAAGMDCDISAANR